MHWLLSCYYCGGQLRWPTKLAHDPIHGARVSVCNGHCGAQLWKLKMKIERNTRALEAAHKGQDAQDPDSTSKFNATIEFLSSRAAIVTLTDTQGEWSGSSRIETKRGSKSDLYELGYTHASTAATDKGGRLETYRRA